MIKALSGQLLSTVWRQAGSASDCQQAGSASDCQQAGSASDHRAVVPRELLMASC